MPNVFEGKNFFGDWNPEKVLFYEKILLCFPSGLEFGESFGDFVSFLVFYVVCKRFWRLGKLYFRTPCTGEWQGRLTPGNSRDPEILAGSGPR